MSAEADDSTPKKYAGIRARAAKKRAEARDARLPEYIHVTPEAIDAFLTEHPVDPKDLPADRPVSPLAFLLPESGPHWWLGIGCGVFACFPLSGLVVALGVMFTEPGSGPALGVAIALPLTLACLLPMIRHRARYLKIMRGTPVMAVVRMVASLEIDSQDHQRVLYVYRLGETRGRGEFVRAVTKQAFAVGDPLPIKVDPQDPTSSRPVWS